MALQAARILAAKDLPLAIECQSGSSLSGLPYSDKDGFRSLEPCPMQLLSVRHCSAKIRLQEALGKWPDVAAVIRSMPATERNAGPACNGELIPTCR